MAITIAMKLVTRRQLRVVPPSTKIQHVTLGESNLFENEVQPGWTQNKNCAFNALETDHSERPPQFSAKQHTAACPANKLSQERSVFDFPL